MGGRVHLGVSDFLSVMYWRWGEGSEINNPWRRGQTFSGGQTFALTPASAFAASAFAASALAKC